MFGAANAGAEVTDILFNTGKRVAGSVVSRPGTVWWGWNATADAVPEGREDEYYDTRLDVFSLRERRHLGRYVWDSADGRLLDRGGEPAVYVPEYDNAMVPQVVIYRAGSAWR